MIGQWAARELGGASYLMETYHHPTPENPYLEIDPILWQTSPLSEGPRPVPQSCTTSSIATSVETRTASTVGPSASMATDQAPEGLHNAPPLSSNHSSSPHEIPESSSRGNETGPRVLTLSSAQLEGPSIGCTVPIGVTSPPSVQTSYASQSMELTLDHSMDRFVGQYLDLVLPVPGNPQISQVFYANMHTLTLEGNPLMIVKVEGIQKTYGTTIFAVGHLSDRFHVITRDGVTPLNMYRWEAAPPSSMTMNDNLLGNLLTPTLMTTSTPVVADNAHTQELPQGTTHTQRPESQEALHWTGRNAPPGATEACPLRAAIEEVSSASTLIEGEDITMEQDYEATIQKLA